MHATSKLQVLLENKHVDFVSFMRTMFSLVGYDGNEFSVQQRIIFESVPTNR